MTSIVVVADSGTPDDKHAALSTDALTWTGRTTPLFPNGSAKDYSDVCYSPALDMLCAISAGGGTANIMISTDHGETWTPITTSDNNSWNSICWSQTLHLFVAVASDGTNRVLTSPDGHVWTGRTAAEANQWRGVCWSFDLGLLVAVANSGTHRVMTSPDGITWTPQTHAIDNCLTIAWDQVSGLLCAIGATAGHTQTSPDGTTWTDNDCSVDISTGTYSHITSDNGGHFLIVGQLGRAAISTDGVAWALTDNILGGSVPLTGACRIWTLDLWCVVGNTGVATSPDGTTWTLRTIPSTTVWKAVVEVAYGSWDGAVTVEANVGIAQAGGPGTYPANDITLTWSRRNRVGGSPLFVTDDVPLSEATEEYEVDVMVAGAVLRTFLGLTTPRVVYTVAQQVADGWTTLPNQLTLRVYQISAVVGRGLTDEVTVDVTG